jgi:flagellar assembly protein FliH
MEKDRKFFFDVNIFDAPPKEEIPEDLPPPPPTFSEEELAAAKDISFEQGRQQGRKEEKESREQAVAATLSKIADSFSHLFAAETVRESIFEKESLRLAIQSLDLLFPLLNKKTGPDEVRKVIEKTLIHHRKTKEILIRIPPGMKGEIETLISRIRKDEHQEALWRVLEDEGLSPGNCTLEWADGGAVRDSLKAAREIRWNMELLLGEEVPLAASREDSDDGESVVLSKEKTESASSPGENE